MRRSTGGPALPATALVYPECDREIHATRPNKNPDSKTLPDLPFGVSAAARWRPSSVMPVPAFSSYRKRHSHCFRTFFAPRRRVTSRGPTRCVVKPLELPLSLVLKCGSTKRCFGGWRAGCIRISRCMSWQPSSLRKTKPPVRPPTKSRNIAARGSDRSTTRPCLESAFFVFMWSRSSPRLASCTTSKARKSSWMERMSRPSASPARIGPQPASNACNVQYGSSAPAESLSFRPSQRSAGSDHPPLEHQ
jgi:hypothetical protein